MSVMVTRLKKSSMDLNRKLGQKLVSKERRAVKMLEIMFRHPECSRLHMM